ncbi:hypothetical protein PIB30_062658 [Stylosanthes scabra]|uniref:Uncharacterized protein n=1 Tax=Stylosanthes scabra TaxID=79078 RepID=A0ABU6QLY9_9FABA|nr:hypothetical protein [Stylosanthes scabra]
MGSEIIYYEIERRDKYEDSEERADSDLAVVKTRRYHFDDDSFVHPLHSVRFDPDHPYELPIENLLALSVRSLRPRENPHLEGQEVSSSQDRRIWEAGRPIKSWELILSSEDWMYEGDEVEDKGEEVDKNEDAIAVKVGEKKEVEEEEDMEEDELEEEMHALPRPMDVDADEEYLQYLEELRQHPNTLSFIVVRRLPSVPLTTRSLSFQMDT